ncbi:MAG: hypothetical protein P9F75_07525 [Candidatus Contendobacter sp.]|nr:hypothetical protein [Candidatus Contendobacter sp.]
MTVSNAHPPAGRPWAAPRHLGPEPVPYPRVLARLGPTPNVEPHPLYPNPPSVVLGMNSDARSGAIPPTRTRSTAGPDLEPVLLIGERASATPTRSRTRCTPEYGLSTTMLAAGRRQAWTLATRIAFRHGFPRLVRRCPIGYGFLVIDLPSPAALPAPDPGAIRIALWWQLASSSGLFTAPRETVIPLLPDSSPLGRLLRDPDRPFAALRAALAPPEPETALALLGQHAEAEDWRDVLRLLAVCRRLQHGTRSGGIDLWRRDARQRS